MDTRQAMLTKFGSIWMFWVFGDDSNREKRLFSLFDNDYLLYCIESYMVDS